eukprot:scaffold639820_cov15-Prasinocladus_malaysianus.AAC.1
MGDAVVTDWVHHIYADDKQSVENPYYFLHWSGVRVSAASFGRRPKFFIATRTSMSTSSLKP